MQAPLCPVGGFRAVRFNRKQRRFVARTVPEWNPPFPGSYVVNETRSQLLALFGAIVLASLCFGAFRAGQSRRPEPETAAGLAPITGDEQEASARELLDTFKTRYDAMQSEVAALRREVQQLRSRLGEVPPP
jgi:hypothetical protein